MKEPRRLAEHVVHDASPARFERQWSAIAERARPAAPRSRAWGWIAAAAAVAACAALITFVRTQGGEAPAEDAFVGATFEGGDDDVRVDLADGTTIDLDAHGRLELASRDARQTRFRVRRGRAHFEVAPQHGRTFVVQARDVEVVVVGTAFSVQLDDRLIEVHVDHGIVEVRRPGVETRRLSAGEELRIGEPEPIATADAPEPAHHEPVSHAPRRSPAQDIWDRATAARRAGDAREAAEAYDSFVRASPRGSQAALASFELGRLRMDRLDDPGGAIEALTRALRLAPSAGFAEDARARLAQAAEQAGRTAECRRAREDYLRRYPDGVHRPQVAGRCPP
jgi:tetratricopeptide (TPR) repeat protein